MELGNEVGWNSSTHSSKIDVCVATFLQKENQRSSPTFISLTQAYYLNPSAVALAFQEMRTLYASGREFSYKNSDMRTNEMEK